MSDIPERAHEEVEPILDWLKVCTDCTELDITMTADEICLWAVFKTHKIEVAFQRIPIPNFTIAEVLEVVKNVVQSVSQGCIINHGNITGPS